MGLMDNAALRGLVGLVTFAALTLLALVFAIAAVRAPLRLIPAIVLGGLAVVVLRWVLSGRKRRRGSERSHRDRESRPEKVWMTTALDSDLETRAERIQELHGHIRAALSESGIASVEPDLITAAERQSRTLLTTAEDLIRRSHRLRRSLDAYDRPQLERRIADLQVAFDRTAETERAEELLEQRDDEQQRLAALERVEEVQRRLLSDLDDVICAQETLHLSLEGSVDSVDVAEKVGRAEELVDQLSALSEAMDEVEGVSR